MFNRIIEKTSNEEGKYAENTIQYLYESTGEDYKDVLSDEEFQKIDVDALIRGKKIEIKNDTWIARTKNAVYETNTHVNDEQANKFKSFLYEKRRKGEKISFDEIPLHYGSIGCNEKCEADGIYYVSVNEEEPENRRYALNRENPFYYINEKKFKEYVRGKSFEPKMVKVKFQEEDNASNIFICINIDELISAGVAKRATQFARDILEEKANIFYSYHTSQELKQLLLTENKKLI